MKQLEQKLYLTIGEVATRIGRIPQTLKNWLTWYEAQTEETKQKFPLPMPITNLDTKGTRYFQEEDIAIFEEFKNRVQYGTMAEFSITRWGKRGQEIQQRKEEVK